MCGKSRFRVRVFVTGSVVVDASALRSSAYLDTIVDELGHVLGLWLVHHGVSVVSCDDKCLETHASLGMSDIFLPKTFS